MDSLKRTVILCFYFLVHSLGSVQHVHAMCDVLEVTKAYNNDIAGLYYAIHDLSCTNRHIYRQDSREHYLFYEQGQWIINGQYVCEGKERDGARATTKSNSLLPEHVYSQWRESVQDGRWEESRLHVACYVNGLTSDAVNSRVGFSAGAAVAFILLVSFIFGCIKRRIRASQDRTRFMDYEMETLSGYTESTRMRRHLPPNSYIMTIADLPAPPRTAEELNLPRGSSNYSSSSRATRYHPVMHVPDYEERNNEPNLTDATLPPSYEEAVYKNIPQGGSSSLMPEPPPYAGAPPDYSTMPSQQNEVVTGVISSQTGENPSVDEEDKGHTTS